MYEHAQDWNVVGVHLSGCLDQSVDRDSWTRVAPTRGHSYRLREPAIDAAGGYLTCWSGDDGCHCDEIVMYCGTTHL